MIWQEQVQVIAMLTNVVENGKVNRNIVFESSAYVHNSQHKSVIVTETVL
jgi:hypothetical protein